MHGSGVVNVELWWWCDERGSVSVVNEAVDGAPEVNLLGRQCPPTLANSEGGSRCNKHYTHINKVLEGGRGGRTGMEGILALTWPRSLLSYSPGAQHWLRLSWISYLHPLADTLGGKWMEISWEESHNYHRQMGTSDDTRRRPGRGFPLPDEPIGRRPSEPC
ncbi:hypothetical protein Pcinc_038039 [Petrolisthes cinctipes]|uniref:Uncharacterized protein n=1 Tax=Petrolisthes cinctipes TaxID=88211 RepID=A0AAE1BRB3_PETCI|nr:hypothetical protein Pcinc_038039 [Petrolisthes cinctipes]